MTELEAKQAELPTRHVFEGELNTYTIDSSRWLTINDRFFDDLIPSSWIGRKIRVSFELVE